MELVVVNPATNGVEEERILSNVATIGSKNKEYASIMLQSEVYELNAQGTFQQRKVRNHFINMKVEEMVDYIKKTNLVPGGDFNQITKQNLQIFIKESFEGDERSGKLRPYKTSKGSKFTLCGVVNEDGEFQQIYRATALIPAGNPGAKDNLIEHTHEMNLETKEILAKEDMVEVFSNMITI